MLELISLLIVSQLLSPGSVSGLAHCNGAAGSQTPIDVANMLSQEYISIYKDKYIFLSLFQKTNSKRTDVPRMFSMADKQLTIPGGNGQVKVEAFSEFEKGYSFQMAGEHWCKVLYINKKVDGKDKIVDETTCGKDNFPALAEVTSMFAVALNDDGSWFVSGQSPQGFKLYQLNSERTTVLRSSDLYSDASQIPSAMVKVGKNETRLFYQGITAEVNVLDMTQLPKIHTNAYLTSSGPWVACPQNFCFDTSVDAVIKTSSGFRMFRGHYYWDVTARTVSEPKQLTKDLEFIDAAVSLGEIEYHFNDNSVRSRKSGADELDYELIAGQFPCIRQPIDGALNFKDEVVLIRGQTFWIFTKTSGFAFRYKNSGNLTNLIGGNDVLDDIDAAVGYKSDENWVIMLFKNQHVLQTTMTNDGVKSSELKVTAGVIGCADEFYTDASKCPECKQLSIADKESFIHYRALFTPALEQKTGPAQTECPKSEFVGGPIRRVNRRKAKSRRLQIAGLVLALIGFLITIMVLVMFFYNRKKSGDGAASPSKKQNKSGSKESLRSGGSGGPISGGSGPLKSFRSLLQPGKAKKAGSSDSVGSAGSAGSAGGVPKVHFSGHKAAKTGSAGSASESSISS